MTDTTARDAAIQAVKDHPSTTFMAPYESLADAVLTAATPLIRTQTFRDGARIVESLPLDTAVMAFGGVVAEAYRRALNAAAAVLAERAERPALGITAEEATANAVSNAATFGQPSKSFAPSQPETTHQGPDPFYGGLSTHVGTREKCTAPDCGPLDPEDEIRDAVLDLEAHLDEPELTKDPWLSMCHGDRLVHAGPDHENHPPIRVVDEPMSNGANADYIALMHPGVGRLLANLLHEIAEDHGPGLDNRQAIHQAAHKLATTINNRPQ
ncbi:hypothetical protein [Streptomyces rubiginosohelvolus]|uniref:HNH endonuclease n=1 Tax=Streptomyces rubiginosohelvolus TaxID=67362 RepID=A0ABQ3BS51_9ACTN|nr:hypothetical protein [Streptomyces pluricolorescens]GGZ51530.1 hypothetical protein GCM10010328_27720 [Streptomyces pluricolorescens]